MTAMSSKKVKKFFGFAENTRRSFGCDCMQVVNSSPDLYAFRLINTDDVLANDEETLAYYGISLNHKEYVNMRLIPSSEIPPERLKCLNLNSVERYDKDDKSFTTYAAKMRHGPLEWVIEYRYSEFSSFHSKLKEDFPSTIFPKFPGKHSLEKHTSEFILNRANELKEYIDKFLELPDEVIQSIYALKFLGMVSTVQNDISAKKGWKVMHMSMLGDMAGPGDILLFKNKTTTSSLQRKVTGSEWDHVALIVPGKGEHLSLLEATGAGVETHDLLLRLKTYNTGI